MKKTRAAVPHLRKPTTAYKLLDAVCEAILAEPRRYNQRQWITRQEPDDFDADRFPVCGTICCVAGWVETLRSSPARTARLARTPEGDKWLIEDVAADTLGLDPVAATRLFAADALNHAGHAESGTPAYARAGVRHIRRFQRQHAIELKRKAVSVLSPKAR